MKPGQLLLVGTLHGAVFGLVFALYSIFLQHQSVPAGIVTGAVSGTFFGVAMAWVINRGHRKLVAGIMSSLTAHQVAAAERASVRGPWPEDDRVLAAATELAHRRLVLDARRRTASFLAFAVLMVFTAAMAVWSDPLWWVGTALLALSCALNHRRSRRLQQRVADLSAAGSPTT